MAELTELTLDPDELTLGDIDTIEEMTGVPFDEALEQLGKLSTKAMIAFVFVLGRQRDPAFTVEDAKRVKVGTLAAITPSEVTPNGNGATVDPPQAVTA